MIVKFLFNTQMIWMILTKILKNIIQIIIVFHDMIADLLSNKKLNLIVTELFIRHRRLNLYVAFITQSYFAVPKNTSLNSTQCFIMKIPNKQEIQQNTFNHLLDIDYQVFMSIYKKNYCKTILLMLLFLQILLHVSQGI